MTAFRSGREPGRVASRVTGLIAAAALLLALPAASRAQSCAGDCNGDGAVSIDEALIAAHVALGVLSPAACPGLTAGVDRAVAAVRSSLGGCAAGAAAAPRSAGDPVRIALGVATGSAGAQVSIAATLHANGNVVAGTQNDIAFDPLAPIVSCAKEPGGKDVFVGFQPPGCTPGEDCTAVRLLVLSLTDVDPIPDGSVLYRCTVAINHTAPDGTYPLLSSAEGAATPDGEAIATEGDDGAVVVAGGAICGGDCNGDNAVTINELIHGINILLGNTSLAGCPAADFNGSASVTVDESVAATGNAHQGCATHPTGPPASGPIEIALGSVTGTAGTIVAVDATLHAFGQHVAATQNDVSFDAHTPILARTNGRPDCAPGAAIDKSATSFAFLPNGCTPEVDCTGVRALVTALDNFDVIPTGATLYTCTIAIAPAAANGGYPLLVSTARGSTPGGRPITAGWSHGLVTVVGGSSPTPTPTATPATRIVVGDAVGIAGQITTFGVGLETNQVVAATENELRVDAAAPLVFSSCAVNPAINKPASAFGFRPFSCLPGVNCSGVKALILSFSDVAPIANGSTMYFCDVLILPAAAPGDYPVDCFAPLGSTPFGEPVPAECIDGTVTVLPDGPPVAPAALILEQARLRADTSNRRANGRAALRGVVNANAPFGGLAEDIAGGGVTVALAGAGGVDLPLAWSAAQCSARSTARGPQIRCAADDAVGRRRLTLRPTRTPNLLQLTLSGARLALPGPFSAAPVEATLLTTSFRRPDAIGGCEVRRQGVTTRCRETGVVP